MFARKNHMTLKDLKTIVTDTVIPSNIRFQNRIVQRMFDLHYSEPLCQIYEVQNWPKRFSREAIIIKKKDNFHYVVLSYRKFNFFLNRLLTLWYQFTNKNYLICQPIKQKKVFEENSETKSLTVACFITNLLTKELSLL